MAKYGGCLQVLEYTQKWRTAFFGEMPKMVVLKWAIFKTTKIPYFRDHPKKGRFFRTTKNRPFFGGPKMAFFRTWK